MRILPIVSLVVFLSAHAAVAQVIVRERPNDVSDLLTLQDGSAQLSLTGVNLLNCELVGYAQKDRLRLALPRPGTTLDVPDHILLPGGGSLWRARQGADSLILHVTPGGTPRVLLRQPMQTGGIAPQVAVAPDGSCALVVAGGQVWKLDTVLGTAAASLTMHLGSLLVTTESLRVNAFVAYFVADDVLYRADHGGTAQPVSIPLLQDEEICSELLLASSSDAAVVMLEGEEEDDRRLAAVRGLQDLEWIVPTPHAIPLPGLDEELGPFIAISPDGARVAWRTDGTVEELFFKCLGGGAPQHVTTLPDYPAYVDNVGVLAFGTSNRLCFFAGDRVLSGITDSDLIGAADMYAVTADAECNLSSENVSGTSGSFAPPFTLPGSINLEATALDPLGQRFFVVQEPPHGDEVLSSFAVGQPVGSQGYGTADILDQQEDFEFFPLGESMLVVTEFESGPSVRVLLSVVAPFGDPNFETMRLGSWSAGTTVTQVAFHGTSACIRLQTPSGPEVYWLDVNRCQLEAVLPAVMGSHLHIDRPVAFDPEGRLVAGAVNPSGSRRWMQVTRPMKAGLLRVQARNGYVLPY